jgi:hypothetical protein
MSEMDRNAILEEAAKAVEGLVLSGFRVGEAQARIAEAIRALKSLPL